MRFFNLLLVLSLLGGASFLFYETVDARPGGGQNYRSPGRRSSSSGSRYHRSSPASPRRNYKRSVGVPIPIPEPGTARPIRSSSYSSDKRNNCGTGLGTFIFILAIVVVVLWVMSRQKKGRAGLSVDSAAQARGIAALKSRDPGFDSAAFINRTQTTMARINEAWVKGNMGEVRLLLSDGIYLQFQTQLNILRHYGLRNSMSDWRAVSANILAATSDPHWDTVHMKVVGEARDADVPLEWDHQRAMKIVQSAELTQYQEVWSFLRRRGQQTKEGVPALDGRCPNCGASLPLSEVVRCEYCQAIINSGEHDWVLAEITQPEEWSLVDAERIIPGLDTIRQRDPALSRQELEDRASVIFWKWVEARTTGNTDKIARFCLATSSSLAALEQHFQPAELRHIAIGSAEVIKVIPGDSNSRDQVLVEICWSASVNGGESVGMIHTFTLSRSVGSLSKRGLSSLDCPVCAAPLVQSDAVICAYCGEKLTSGQHEWVLETITAGELPLD